MSPNEKTVKVRWFASILDKATRQERMDYPMRPVAFYCPEELRGKDDLRAVHNGLVVHRDCWAIERALPGDELIFYRLPEGTATLLLLAASIVLTGVSFAVSALTAPSAAPLESDLETSATYGFDGRYNTIQPGTPIPIVYGTHRVAGHILGQFQRKARGPADTDPKSSELHTLIGLCTGRIESVSEVRANKNPTSDYGDAVELESRLGTNHQAPLAGFREVVTSYPKNSDLTYTGGVQEFTTAGEVDRVEIAIRFPGGLFSITDKGQYTIRRVVIQASWKETWDGQEENEDGWYPFWPLNVEHKSKSPFDAWYPSPVLKRAQYKLRVQRVTPDDTQASGFSAALVRSVNDVVEEVLTYPRIALLAVRQLPTSQLSGAAPAYDALVKGKHVRVYSDTSTYVEQWSDNPMWCLLDFLTGDFDGQGPELSLDRINLQSFIDVAATCSPQAPVDEGGETEQRFRLNLVVDGSISVIDTIRQMCTTAQANLYLQGDKWTVRADKEEDSVQLFQMSRILKDSFKVHKKARSQVANYLIGQFWNEELDYEQDTLPEADSTLDEDDQHVEKTVNLMGSTTVSQVRRLLHHMMLENRLSRRVVEFEAGTEALNIEAGDVFDVAHDVPGWGYSGKILQVFDGAGSDIVLDRTLTIEAGKSYQLTVIHADDTIEVATVTSNPGTYARIQVAADWDTALVAGVDYAFGEVSQATLKFRCLSITRGSLPNKRKIRARQYSAAAYGTDLSVLPAPSISRLPDPDRLPDPVTHLRLVEREVYAEDGTLSVAIDAHFTLPAVAGARAQVFWREAGGVYWEPVSAPVDAGFASITRDIRAPGVTYEVSVVSVSATGNRRAPALGVKAEITTVGTTRQPSNVVGFTADRTLEGLVFTWDAIDPAVNFDLSYYEVREGTAWDAAIALGRATNTKLETRAYVSGSRTFLLKAVNTAGKESPLAASVVMVVDERIGENVVFTRQEDSSWPGTKDGFVVDGNDLRLDTEDSIVAWRAAPRSPRSPTALIPGGYAAGYRVTGTYTTAAFQIATDALRCLISTDFLADQIDATLTWESADVSGQTWGGEFAKSQTWGLAPDGRVSVKVEMRFSSTTSDEGAFGAWQVRAQNIEALVKWAQVRVVVVVKDPSYTVKISRLRVIFDVPDVVEGGTLTTSATATVAVTFDKTFHAEPKVAATVIGATAGDEVFLTGKDKDGFDIEVKNATVRVVRTVNFTAVGY